MRERETNGATFVLLAEGNDARSIRFTIKLETRQAPNNTSRKSERVKQFTAKGEDEKSKMYYCMFKVLRLYFNAE
jgi:hypothetical protein